MLNVSCFWYTLSFFVILTDKHKILTLGKGKRKSQNDELFFDNSLEPPDDELHISFYSPELCVGGLW